VAVGEVGVKDCDEVEALDVTRTEAEELAGDDGGRTLDIAEVVEAEETDCPMLLKTI
jgi:hypothetical protein